MLTALKVRKAKCPPDKRRIKLYDGQGLYLLVTDKGGKYWRMDYRYNGKRKTLALGVYPEVSLEEAREAALKARKALRQGMDPVLAKRLERAQGATVRELYEEWFSRHSKTTAPKTAARIASLMERYALPIIGSIPVQQITPQTVLSVLRVLEAQGKISSAHKLRKIIGQLFRYGLATGAVMMDPTAALRGALAPERPRPRPAIVDPRKLGELMRAIAGYGGFASIRNALDFLARTFVRPVELRLACREEFDLQARLWRIPASRMKMRREHLVPLSEQAIAILEDQKKRYPLREFAFPGTRPGRPLSDNTLNMALRAMGYDGRTHVAHGFRATARTLLAEHGWPVEAIERQLAHVEANSAVRAYARSEYLDTRREMMQAWSDYLDLLREERYQEAAERLRFRMFR